MAGLRATYLCAGGPHSTPGHLDVKSPLGILLPSQTWVIGGLSAPLPVTDGFSNCLQDTGKEEPILRPGFSIGRRPCKPVSGVCDGPGHPVLEFLRTVEVRTFLPPTSLPRDSGFPGLSHGPQVCSSISTTGDSDAHWLFFLLITGEFH